MTPHKAALLALLALGGCGQTDDRPPMTPEAIIKAVGVCEAGGMQARTTYRGAGSIVVWVSCEPRLPCPSYCLPDSALKEPPHE